MTENQLQALRKQVHDAVKAIPQVTLHGVGYGYTEVNGVFTNTIAWRIYVADKLNPTDPHPSTFIPAAYHQIPTFVIITTALQLPTAPTPAPACGDSAVHDVIKGGITIKAKTTQYYGTLGCFCTILGEKSRDHFALLTNSHLMINSNVGDPVYSLAINGTTPNMSTANEIGHVLTAGSMDNVNYQYPGEAELFYFSDCASVKIDTCFSSWCGTNCGQDLSAEILNMNIAGSNFLKGQGRIGMKNVGDTVYKIGRTTGKTKGRIIDPFAFQILGGSTSMNVMLIESTEVNCQGNKVFSTHGDSGAIVINDKAEVVGLLYGGEPGKPQFTYACHIAPCLKKLRLKNVVVNNAGLGKPGTTGSVSPGTLISSNANPRFQRLKARFEQHSAGSELFALIEAHRSEITELVNFRREVTIVWHRSKGPAYMAHFLNSTRNPEYIIPAEVEGVSLPQCLTQIAGALMEQGSPELRSAIEAHYQKVVKLSGHIDTIEDFFELLDVKTDANQETL